MNDEPSICPGFLSEVMKGLNMRIRKQCKKPKLSRKDVKFTLNFTVKPKGYFVYLHRKATDGTVFYVGKGSRDRYKQTDRSNIHWQHTALKHGVLVDIVMDNLQEWYAYELESELVHLYGRSDLGYGTLVNHSDGGDGTNGYICTEEVRAKRRLMIGELSPRFDSKLYTFKNFKTNETRLATKSSMYKDEGVPYTALLRSAEGIAGTYKNWYLPSEITDLELQARLEGFKGKFSHRADHTIYDFTNINTLENIKCKNVEFIELKGVDLSPMILGAIMTSYGWTLTERISEYGLEKLRSPTGGIYNPNTDHTIYDFVNLMNDEEFKGTRLEFETKFNIIVESLFYKRRIRLTTGHWCLLENKSKVLELNGGLYNKHSFINNSTGEIFTGTRVAFRLKYDVNVKVLFADQRKQVKDWSLLK